MPATVMPADEYRLNAMELYQFDTRGFLVKPGFLAAADVMRLRDQLDPRWPEPDDGGHARIQPLTDLPGLEQFAVRIANESGVYSTINQPFRLIESYAVRRAEGSLQVLHNGRSNLNRSAFGVSQRTMWQDHCYHDGLLYCMMVKALVYLTDIQSPADGPFTLVEGSHKANYAFPLPEREVKRGAGLTGPGTHQMYARAGDLLLLNEALTHGSLAKTSPGFRIFLAVSFAPSFVSDYRKLPKDSAALYQLGFCE